MIDFVRLDRGDILVGLAVWVNHALFPFAPNSAIRLADPSGKGHLVLGLRYAAPVHVVVYAMNDNGGVRLDAAQVY